MDGWPKLLINLACCPNIWSHIFPFFLSWDHFILGIINYLFAYIFGWSKILRKLFGASKDMKVMDSRGSYHWSDLFKWLQQAIRKMLMSLSFMDLFHQSFRGTGFSFTWKQPIIILCSCGLSLKDWICAWNCWHKAFPFLTSKHFLSRVSWESEVEFSVNYCLPSKKGEYI